MKNKIILAVALIILVSLIFHKWLEIELIKYRLDNEFTYVPQENHYKTATGEYAFTGNCVTFSDAAYFQLQKKSIPAEQWFVFTEDRQPHMVTCSDGWCLDNRHPLIQRKNNLKYQWLEKVK